MSDKALAVTRNTDTYRARLSTGGDKIIIESVRPADYLRAVEDREDG